MSPLYPLLTLIAPNRHVRAGAKSKTEHHQVGRVLAEGLTVTQRYERISPQHNNVARFQVPLPLPWVDTSAHLFFRLYPQEIFRTPAKSISYLYS